MPKIEWDLIVIGAGAAGLVAAARGAERGQRTLLIEKNRKPGVKILMSGGTRCNLTQATSPRGIVEAFGTRGRFLHSALARLGPDELVGLFRDEGVATKVEPTGKIFPASDKAADVQQALLRRLARSGATLALDEPVVGLSRDAAIFTVTTAKRSLSARRVLITTGGQSYPGCGTTGDGYQWARELGHTIVTPRAALVPITSGAEWVKALKGITVPDVAVAIVERSAHCASATASARAPAGARRRSSRRGSFLFTHFGVSGPAVLDVSREVTAYPEPASLDLECDFLPGLRDHEFDEQLKRLTQTAGARPLEALPFGELPRRLIHSLIGQAGIAGGKRAAELSTAQRAALVNGFKHVRIPVAGTLGFPKAEVTAGGIALDEIDSRSMQSLKVPGLFLAGEVLDLDGPIGGYNFQVAFSTGWLAGESI